MSTAVAELLSGVWLLGMLYWVSYRLSNAKSAAPREVGPCSVSANGAGTSKSSQCIPAPEQAQLSRLSGSHLGGVHAPSIRN